MVEEVKKQVEGIVKTAGRAFLSVKFPRDFEVYFCSFELCSFEGEIIDFFSFPVLPNTVTKKEPYVSNIKKTFGGVSVIKSSDFIPQEIILRGNFGRTFKLIQGKDIVDMFGVAKFSDSEQYKRGTFNDVIKTGYGATKYLQAIIERSKIFDTPKNLPRVLFFHNSMLGESYIVEPMQVQFEQSLESNMVWNYSLNLTITKSFDYGKGGKTFFTKKGMKESLRKSSINGVKGPVVDKLVNTGSSLLRKGLVELL